MRKIIYILLLVFFALTFVKVGSACISHNGVEWGTYRLDQIGSCVISEDECCPDNDKDGIPACAPQNDLNNCASTPGCICGPWWWPIYSPTAPDCDDSDPHIPLNDTCINHRIESVKILSNDSRVQWMDRQQKNPLELSVLDIINLEVQC